jgi:hypothetical protein
MQRIFGAVALSALVAGCTSPPEDDDSAAGAGGLGGGSSFAGSGGTGTSTGGSVSQGGQGGSAVSTAGTGGAAAGAGGSAGNSGGAGMAGAAGAGMVVGPTSALCPEGSLFCDSFEDDTVGQPPGQPWRESVNGGSVNVNATRAFSGTQAVLANAPLGAAYRRAYFALDQGSSANIFPAAAQQMFGRAMLWLEAAPGTDSHWTFIQGEGVRNDENGEYNALYRYGGQLQQGAQLMANYETTSIGTDCYQHSASTMPVGAWTCVEWRFVVASNEMQFWLNGAELTDIHVTGSGEGCGGDALDGQWLAPPAFQSLYLGWEHYQLPTRDINLWVDDVVVSTTRVLCPAPP